MNHLLKCQKNKLLHKRSRHCKAMSDFSEHSQKLLFKFLILPRALYRRFMQLVDKNYIASKLAKRKGSCKRCGQCCKSCKHLGKDNLCKIYNNRPWLCYKEFPLDKLDQEIWQVTKCGYKFAE